MTSVRSTVPPGWIEVTGDGVHAVVAAAERHGEALAAAAAGGVLGLLEALTAHGLSQAPDFVVVGVGDSRLRVLVRGDGVVRLADGSTVGSQGRMPWADVDVDLATAGEEVVLEPPQPQVPRGWRRPARLSRAAAEPVPLEAEPRQGSEPQAQQQEPAAQQADPKVQQPESEQAEPEARQPEPEAELLEPEPEPQPVPPQPELTLPPPDDAPGLPPVARVPASPPPRSGLIDAVPWRRGTSTPPAHPAAEAAAPGAAGTPPPLPPTAAIPAVAPAPPQQPADAPPSPAPPVEFTAPPEVEQVPEATPAPEPSPGHAVPDVTTDRGSLHRTDDDLDRPVVLAVLCPAGHPSPPHAGRCRTCDREIPPQQPFQTPRPPLGVLRVSTGGVVPLDRGVLLGRAPRVNEELPANQRPHLLRVGGADRDISRNHAEVVLEGWHVLVRDLGSTNGTTVTLPGQEPVRLRPTEDQGIEPGAVITLADEVWLTYEVEE